MNQKYGHPEHSTDLSPHPLPYKQLSAGSLYNPNYPLHHESPPSSSRPHLHLNTPAEAYSRSYEQLSAGIMYNPSSATHEVDPPSWPNHGTENVRPSTLVHNSPVAGPYPTSPIHPFNTTQDPPCQVSHSAGHEGHRHPSHRTVASGELYNPYNPYRMPEACSSHEALPRLGAYTQNSPQEYTPPVYHPHPVRHRLQPEMSPFSLLAHAPPKATSDSLTSVHGSASGESPGDDDKHAHHFWAEVPVEPNRPYGNDGHIATPRPAPPSVKQTPEGEISDSLTSVHGSGGGESAHDNNMHEHRLQAPSPAELSRRSSLMRPGQDLPTPQPSVHPSRASTINHRQSSLHPDDQRNVDGSISTPSVHLQPSRTSTISRQPSLHPNTGLDGPNSNHSVHLQTSPSRASTISRSNSSLHPSQGHKTPTPSITHSKRAYVTSEHSSATLHSDQGHGADGPTSHSSLHLHRSRTFTTISQHSHPNEGHNTPTPSAAHLHPSRAASARLPDIRSST
ncbi:hypothetical protein BDZ97DRAFT_80370 [Flammula alnicola]|nr:hypothetical protein BDZ97DRAFT_80370 [Flammula alnicola]